MIDSAEAWLWFLFLLVLHWHTLFLLTLSSLFPEPPMFFSHAAVFFRIFYEWWEKALGIEQEKETNNKNSTMPA